ncbi:MAG: beta-1,6-N-acetylglucosaminyltransferase [Lautropia sp.]|nr:beta-1,6-N-acetylglucosaminyltransferase [Lautropia sp.]
MSLAFLITAHQQPGQLAQLLHCIQHPDCLYLVLPDRKTLSGDAPALQAVARRHANVIIAPPRDMRWASWSLMQARLDGMAQLLARPEPWKMLINLSGQDLPLRPIEQIIATFRGQEHCNFIDHFDPLSRWADPYARIHRIRIEPPFSSTGINLPRLRIDRWRKELGDARYVGSRPYLVLNRAFCQHMIESPQLPAWRRAMARTYRPDEVMIQSFIMNSPFADSVRQQSFHDEVFDEGASHPRVLTMADRERLARSDKLFARKFDVGVDAEIVRQLVQQLKSG